MSFQQPNRTKSFFASVDAGRPQAAQQKLGGIMGSQSAIQNQTKAQVGENQSVDAAKTGVANSVSSTYANLGETKKLGEHATQRQQFINQGTPVLVDTARPINASSSTRAADLRENTNNAINENARTMGIYENAGKRIVDTTPEAATKELSDAYQKDTGLLDNANRQMTDGNLGRLAGPSSYEIEQAQLQQVLADRNSNVGKLRALYGTGYDTTKYGALDSNLLQGQFNEAQGQSQQNVQALNTANAGGQKSRELYLDQMDTSRGELGKRHNEATANLTEIGNRIKTLDTQISTAKGVAKERLIAFKKKLETTRDTDVVKLQAQDDKDNAARNAYTNSVREAKAAAERAQVQAANEATRAVANNISSVFTQPLKNVAKSVLSPAKQLANAVANPSAVTGAVAKVLSKPANVLAKVAENPAAVAKALVTPSKKVLKRLKFW